MFVRDYYDTSKVLFFDEENGKLFRIHSLYSICKQFKWGLGRVNKLVRKFGLRTYFPEPNPKRGYVDVKGFRVIERYIDNNHDFGLNRVQYLDTIKYLKKLYEGDPQGVRPKVLFNDEQLRYMKKHDDDFGLI